MIDRKRLREMGIPEDMGTDDVKAFFSLPDDDTMHQQPRTYATMAGKSIGKCSSGHCLPLTGNCDLCGVGPDEKCKFSENGDRGSAS